MCCAMSTEHTDPIVEGCPGAYWWISPSTGERFSATHDAPSELFYVYRGAAFYGDYHDGDIDKLACEIEEGVRAETAAKLEPPYDFNIFFGLFS